MIEFFFLESTGITLGTYLLGDYLKAKHAIHKYVADIHT